MSIYSGTAIEQSYRAGVDLGRSFGEADVSDQRSTGSEEVTLRDEARAAREVAHTAPGRSWAAFKLGIVRGYREAVRL